MLFDDQFIDTLKNDPLGKSIEICEVAINRINQSYSNEWTKEEYRDLLETYALLTEIINSGMLKISVNFPKVNGGGAKEECVNLLNFIEDVKAKSSAENSKFSFESLREKFRLSLGIAFHYEFSQGDVERMQDLLNNLRDLVAASDKFEPEHQQRLLKRLERLQTEIHKKVSDLDKFWGLIGDAGVAIGKLGRDAKPMVDRIKEITQIIWQTQSRAEELPSGTSFPQLGGDAKSHSEGEGAV